jgi:hypothetical protein
MLTSFRVEFLSFWVGNSAVDTSWSRTSVLKMEAAQPPKRWYPSTKLRGCISQKTTIYISPLWKSHIIQIPEYFVFKYHHSALSGRSFVPILNSEYCYTIEWAWYCQDLYRANKPSEDKGKGKVVPVFNKAPRHEDVLGEWRYSPTHSLTSALDGGEWSASHPGRFTARERAPGSHWIGGWVGPRAVLDAVVKRKIPSSCRESNLRIPILQPVAQRYTDWAITAHKQTGCSCKFVWVSWFRRSSNTVHISHVW